MSMANQAQSEKKGGAKTVGIVLLVTIILVLAGIIVYLLMSRQPEKEEERRGVVVTPDNVQEVIEQMEQRASEEPVAPGYYTVRMNYEWHFATGDTASEDAYVENLVPCKV